ncbi:MAG TPA: EAL domain-containing protein [Pseudolabrys sp.]|nr:EAL domain-containing protein [Pseudolabrys sp.]
MRRLSAIFIAVCMVVTAASLGAILFLAFKLDARTSAIAALATLTVLALYNAMSNRLRDRGEMGDQIADLSRGTADLARQVAELSRRLNAVETSVSNTVSRARGAVDPLAAEIGELGGLVRELADSVAAHDAALRQSGALQRVAPAAVATADAPLALSESDAVSPPVMRSMGRDAAIDLVTQALDNQRVDLYLQPIVTLPQRKVRFYEAMSRLRTEDGEVVPAAAFVEAAEAAGLMPRIDNLLLFRAVQVVRRLQLKSRDVGIFCNISTGTLTDVAQFRQFLDFVDANRALGDSLTFEFTQSAYRNFGPLEQESLSALAERGFRFSMDHVADLRMEPRELAERSFRFLKVPAKLLLNKASGAQSDIHPEDLADLLARSGIDLIAERIENEATVLDLLDYDVRFGQGFLFSAPRPVRPEALGTADARAELATPAA